MSSHHSQTENPKGDQRYSPLPGSKSQVESPRYRCPVASCHQVWYRPEASENIPQCPIHDVQMVRDSKVH
jgi:hypothetical protein